MDNNSKEKKQKMMRNFSIVYDVFVLCFVVIILTILSLCLFNGEELRQLGNNAHNDSTVVEPRRGNIFDCNGNLLASTLPTYKLYIDFKADGLTRELFYEKIDSLSICLSRFYGDKSAYAYKQMLIRGFNSRDRNFKMSDRILSYTEKKEVSKFPLFNLGPNKSGIKWTERIKREKPFGRLASRTIGNVYADRTRGGYCGIEGGMNSYLSGEKGYASIEKKAGRLVKVIQKAPVDGKDIVSTIDIRMQDIVENSLEKWMMQSDAEKGCAVLMEVGTGKVKAISNLSRPTNGGPYREDENHALRIGSEPGSTFKTASVMVALDGGMVDTCDKFDTGYGEWRSADWVMKDHNVKYDEHGNLTTKGGYHNISLAQAMWYSSNIGIAKMVDSIYSKKPRDFVNRLYNMKLNEPMETEIPGTVAPYIPNPDTKGWNGASLLWMSFGYGIQIPPIYTLTFYNAIANDGKMIQPYFVESIGNGMKKNTARVINPRICSNSTLNKVRKMLEDVVKNGTARPFSSDKVQFAGKTGTAQTRYWDKDKSKMSHQYSFCGYFPADDPKYSCIAVVVHPNRGGPNPAGMTFKDIAERINARFLEAKTVAASKDTSAQLNLPLSRDGNAKATKTVLDELDIDYVASGELNAKWATNSASKETNSINIRGRNVSMNTVPNVVGMGAKDAVYLLESRGLRVKINGKGSVYKQSIPAYSRINLGDWVEIQLK